MGDDGPLYKKDWDGEYRPEEGLFGTPTGHVKRDFLGEPVPTRDIFGNQKRAADGSRLYEAEPDHEAEAVTGIVAVIAIVAVVAAAVAAWIFAKLVRWWWPRLSGSIRKDIDDRRLSWTSLAWLSPIVLLVAIVVVGEVRQNLRDEALALVEVPIEETFAAPTVDVPVVNMLAIDESADIAGVHLWVSVPANDCSGFAFALHAENGSAEELTVVYAFPSEVWGGEPVSAACYSNSLVESFVVLTPGQNEVIGFRDLGFDRTTMTVQVAGRGVAAWDLVHP